MALTLVTLVTWVKATGLVRLAEAAPPRLRPAARPQVADCQGHCDHQEDHAPRRGCGVARRSSEGGTQGELEVNIILDQTTRSWSGFSSIVGGTKASILICYLIVTLVFWVFLSSVFVPGVAILDQMTESWLRE